MLQYLKTPATLTFLTIVGFFVAFFFSVIAKLIFGDSSDALMNYNPIFNGFIHADPTHLIFNLGVLFPLLLFKINQHIKISEFLFITFVISIISLPFSLAQGIPAVGISGTLFFLLSRACLNKRNWFLYIFFAITFGFELLNFSNSSDGMAHYVHVIGSVLGFISLKLQRFNGRENIKKFSIC